MNNDVSYLYEQDYYLYRSAIGRTPRRRDRSHSGAGDRLFRERGFFEKKGVC